MDSIVGDSASLAGLADTMDGSRLSEEVHSEVGACNVFYDLLMSNCVFGSGVYILLLIIVERFCRMNSSFELRVNRYPFS